ncbi:NAD(P)-dependent oxidoreductase [Cellulomonas aerilata]|uniref:3-beta hydroxysteroid dehydrogenase n=1 Tax=Cellulomonas aerilata TaxID=515326 RepID=A0A512DF92_9CELL|nr:NAD(P)H-binding protein [Cellulomonas aerilata]GEO35121.1 3-beta hydroxysteroid dehydrogenase [Cellulomonas aerilata]
MATIVVFGGTGYTGANVVREAASRGHRVISVSRSEPETAVDGVQYQIGSAEDVAPQVVPDADAVVAVLSPRGDMAGRLVQVYAALARLSAEAGARYLQVGGFSSLRPAPGAPRFVEGEVPEQYRDEALEGEATRVLLADDAPGALDWVFVSPAGTYGAWAAGERTGTYRVGGEVALFDEEGGSTISGADFALALVDEIEAADHHREHIGVAY